MTKVVVVVCDNADEQQKAYGYWKKEGYELLSEEVRETSRVSVFEENGGQQEQWTKRYDVEKGVCVLLMKES